MKTLLILSNDKNLSHIALILENLNQNFFALLKSLSEIPNSNNPQVFKNYFFKEAQEKEFFTEFGEQPQFTEIIEDNEIQAVFTYFLNTNNMSFALREDTGFNYYDFKNYVEENTLSTLFNHLGANNGNQYTNATNQGENQEETRRRERTLQSDTGAREEDRQIRGDNERGRTRGEQGVLRTNRGIGETDTISRGQTIWQPRVEQRGGLQGGELHRGDSGESHSPNTSAINQTTQLQGNIQTPQLRDNPQSQTNKEARVKFRRGIKSLLQSQGMREFYAEILLGLSKFSSQNNGEKQRTNPRESNPSTHNRIEERKPRGSRGDNRETQIFKYGESSRFNEVSSTNISDVGDGIESRRKSSTEFDTSNTKGTTNQQILSGNESKLSSELPLSQEKPNLSSHTRKQEEQISHSPQSKEPNGDILSGFNGVLQEVSDNDGYRGENENPNGNNGILSSSPKQDNPSKQDDRETHTARVQEQSNFLQQNIPSSSETPRETQSLSGNQFELSSQRIRGTEEKREDKEYNQQVIQSDQTLSTEFFNETEYERKTPSSIKVKTFGVYDLAKKQKGEEYKGEIDFKLSKKERIQANLEAIKLVGEIQKRRFEIQRSQIDVETGEIDELTKRNSPREYIDFLEKAKTKLLQEFIEKHYFSFECPYNKEEQQCLAKYSGFGGLRDLFYDKAYQEQSEELISLVGKEYYEDLKQSSYNAYYTPSAIIEAMFKGLEQLGVPTNEKITALEPSCGIGHFITKAPPNYEFIAIEKDALSATIAKLLHPQTTIYNDCFENIHFKREFDIVLTNPPYENEKAENSKELIHNYFVLKSQSLLKDGGLGSFVITSGFLDSKTNYHRKQLLQENFLISAFRLPNSSFKNTHTEVLSDIVFFRKTKDKENYLKTIPDWIKRQINDENNCFVNTLEKETIINDEPKIFKINAYFDLFKNSVGTHILGKQEYTLNQFGEAVLKVNGDVGAIQESIQKYLRLNFDTPLYNPAPVFVEENLRLTDFRFDNKTLAYIDALRIGNIFEYDGKFYVKEEHLGITEVFFEDEFEIAKKYLLSEEKKQIIKEKETKLIYKNPLNDNEKEILRKIIEFRDLLNTNLLFERIKGNTEEENIKILEQKAKLRALRYEILNLSNTKGFNVSKAQNKKNEKGIIIQHSLRKLIELEKLENFKIFATENVIEIPKRNKFEYHYEEADILKKRVLFPLQKTLAKNSKEALQKTINEKGFIDLVTLKSYLPKKNIEEIIIELTHNELIFPSFDERKTNSQYCLKSEFLSGNIKAKAKEIERMIKENHNFNAYSLSKERYLEILKENFPKDISYEDLEVNFGANFVDKEIYEDFIKQSFFTNPQEVNVQINILNGEYILEDFTKGIMNDIGTELEIKNQKGEIHFNLKALLERTLNNKSLEVAHYEKIDENKNKRIVEQEPTSQALKNANYIKDFFADFIFRNQKYRESIEQRYNEQINVFSNVKFEFQDFLETPYLNKDINLRAHQKNAIFKGIMKNSLLFDHQVGAGKTLIGIALTMEQIRMGLIKKALILVPNHLSSAWGAEFIRAYPSAKILVGDKINNKKERKEFLYRARNGDYDAIIMKHSTFENMNVMESFEVEILENQIRLLRGQLEKEKNAGKALINSKEEKKIAIAIDKAIDKYEKKLKNLAKGKTYDDEIAFEDLGIDCLIVDEAHYFKNLFITTSQQNVRGIPTQESKKAMKMFCATQYCHQNNFKLYFLTGTPISNSIAEFFTMQRYLQPHILKELNLENFDEWQKTFTNITLSEELDSSGVNYALVNRLSSFVNAPELMNIYKQNADIVTTEEIEKLSGKLTPKLKEGKAINVVVPRSESVANFIGVEDEFGNYNEGSIIDRMNNFASDPQRNNVLVCTSEARKAALDFRLIDHYADDYETSKVNKMVELVKRHYDDSRYERNTQLIFCDLGVSKKNSQKIDIEAKEKFELESLEEIAKRKGLEFHTEYDEDGNEIRSYYKEFEKDENNKFVYEEVIDEEGNKKKEKIVSKIYEIEELLNEQIQFDVYSDILKKLVKAGIPQKEIAFIGDAKNDKAKQALFDKVNEGKVRILIGSTAKMGTGTNVQERIVAMHELDCPWKPSELEQRAGRGIRQGNIFFEKDKENFEIAHYRYATEQTYDARMFQINEQKLKPLVQMKKADISENIRVFKGIDEEMVNIADMKAIATGNPFILEKHKIENLLKKEEDYKKYYEKSIISNEKSLKLELKRREALKDNLEALKTMSFNKDFSKENYVLEVLGVKTTKKPKNKADEKSHNELRERIESRIIKMLRQTENFTQVDEKEQEKRKIDFLKANGISVKFHSILHKDTFQLIGVIVMQDNKQFIPKNLKYTFERNNLFKTEFNLNSFLTRVKNTFDKVSSLLEETAQELKICENSIQFKESFLKNNTLETYERKFIIDILKQDKFNIEEIFKIRQAKRKEGIKIVLESEEIKHLLPQYPKFLDDKGKLIAQKNESNNNEKEQLTEQDKRNNDEIEPIITQEKEDANLQIEFVKEDIKINENEKIEIKKEYELKRKLENPEISKESTINISQTESKEVESNIADVKINLKKFDKSSSLEDRMRILEQNMKNIQKNTHSRSILNNVYQH